MAKRLREEDQPSKVSRCAPEPTSSLATALATLAQLETVALPCVGGDGGPAWHQTSRRQPPPAGGEHSAAATSHPPHPEPPCCTLQNLAHAVPAGWDALPVSHASAKQLLAPPGCEPLRPTNQASPDAAAAANLSHHQQQQYSLQESQQQQQHPALQHDAACAHAGAAAAELRCQDIDWRSPEQVAQLLRMLHLERLRRQGLQLPAEYLQQPHPHQ